MTANYRTVLVVAIALMTVTGLGALPVAAQEETPTETPADEEATPTEEGATPMEGEETANVTFANVTTNGTAVSVESVTLPEGGFVLIYTLNESAVQDGAAADVTPAEDEATPTEEDAADATPADDETPTDEEATPTDGEGAAVDEETPTEEEDGVGAEETPTDEEATPADDAAETPTDENATDGDVLDDEENVTDGEENVTDAAGETPTDADAADGTVTSVSEVNESVLGQNVGNSSYLEAGTSENVTVHYDGTQVRDQVLVAVAFQDMNENQEFDGVAFEAPYYDDQNEIVADWAFVTVVEDGAAETPTDEGATPTDEAATPAEETPADEEATPADEETTPADDGEGDAVDEETPTEEDATPEA